MSDSRALNVALKVGGFMFTVLQWVVGVRMKKKNLNTRNLFDVVMIVLATWFLFPIYSGFIDIFAQAVDGDVVNKFAVEGFRYSFIVSSVWLILISMFSEAKFSIVRFVTLVIPGMVLGIVITYLLGIFVHYLQGIWEIDQLTLFVMTIYPLAFSYFVRYKVNQVAKYKPEVPKLTQLQRSVWLE